MICCDTVKERCRHRAEGRERRAREKDQRRGRGKPTLGCKETDNDSELNNRNTTEIFRISRI